MLSPPIPFGPPHPSTLPRLRRWLNAPEVRRWWGNPNEEFELLRGDLNEPLMMMRIVSLGQRPFAYVQDYEVHSWLQPHLPICRWDRARLTASSVGHR
jgi:aminoglycoside 6'-N-acetyltransferase